MKKHIGEYVLAALLFCYLFSSFLEFKGTFILFLMIIVITPFVLIGRYKERKAVENYDNNKIDIKKDKKLLANIYLGGIKKKIEFNYIPETPSGHVLRSTSSSPFSSRNLHWHIQYQNHIGHK